VADPTGDRDRIIFLYIHADTPFLSHTLLRLVGHVGGSDGGPLWGHVYTLHWGNFGKGRGGDSRLTRISLWIFLGGYLWIWILLFGGTGDRKQKEEKKRTRLGALGGGCIKRCGLSFACCPCFLGLEWYHSVCGDF